MKILSAEQIRAVDQYTIAREPIASIDLMERAALAIVRKLIKHIDSDGKVSIACGKGNNGGDGLAVGRLLLERGFDVTVFVIHYKTDFSEEAKTNDGLFRSKFPERLHDIHSVEELKQKIAEPHAVLIDALLGTGTNKPVEDLLGECIDLFNHSFRKIISIDVPSGLFIDSTSRDNKHVIRSTFTISLQLPKLAFLLPENRNFVPHFEMIDIGLAQEAINGLQSANHFISKHLIAPLLRPRNKFDHKGTFGHALLLAGSKGKSGAAVISAKACLRSGAGLLTVHSTKDVLLAVVNHLPEAMGIADNTEDHIAEIEKPEFFDAIGFGPGTGLHEDTQNTLKKLLNYYRGKLVIDADGLNILSENKTWLSFLPPGTILTPHPKEFERLAGKSENDFERLETLRQFSIKNNCIVVLKGAHSAIAMPDGNIFFNSNGNPGLAKAGSGDALTGIILGLMTRGYNAPQAALIGVFVHGLAADICLKKMSAESILISDVIQQLPKAFKRLEKGS